jgi:uncharacterized protein YbjT (DUF2867 family)
MPEPFRRVLVIGATGLVGAEVVRRLAARDSVAEVIALVRRAPAARPSTKVSYRVVDFGALDAVADAFAVDAVVSALGTTARATPDPVRYREVEHAIPLAVITRAHARGARRAALVSTVGANPASRATYLRQKGELERDVEALGWERLVIARPSTLIGARKDFRFNERLGVWAGPLLPARYKPVRGDQVAAATVAALVADGPAVQVLDNVTLRQA